MWTTLFGGLLGLVIGWLVGSLVVRVLDRLLAWDEGLEKSEGAPVIVFEALIGAVTGAVALHYLTGLHTLYLSLATTAGIPLLVAIFLGLNWLLAEYVDKRVSVFIYDSPKLLLAGLRDLSLYLYSKATGKVVKPAQPAETAPTAEPAKLVTPTIHPEGALQRDVPVAKVAEVAAPQAIQVQAGSATATPANLPAEPTAGEKEARADSQVSTATAEPQPKPTQVETPAVSALVTEPATQTAPATEPSPMAVEGTAAPTAAVTVLFPVGNADEIVADRTAAAAQIDRVPRPAHQEALLDPVPALVGTEVTQPAPTAAATETVTQPGAQAERKVDATVTDKLLFAGLAAALKGGDQQQQVRQEKPGTATPATKDEPPQS